MGCVAKNAKHVHKPSRFQELWREEVKWSEVNLHSEVMCEVGLMNVSSKSQNKNRNTLCLKLIQSFCWTVEIILYVHLQTISRLLHLVLSHQCHPGEFLTSVPHMKEKNNRSNLEFLITVLNTCWCPPEVFRTWLVFWHVNVEEQWH